MNDNSNIFDAGKGAAKGIPEDRLMAYLEGKLPPEEQREIEKWLADEGMESDALEGLQQMSPAEVNHARGRLNHKLRTAIYSKKRRRKSLKTDQFSWVAIAIVLLLVVVAFLVIRKAM